MDDRSHKLFHLGSSFKKIKLTFTPFNLLSQMWHIYTHIEKIIKIYGRGWERRYALHAVSTCAGQRSISAALQTGILESLPLGWDQLIRNRGNPSDRSVVMDAWAQGLTFAAMPFWNTVFFTLKSTLPDRIWLSGLGCQVDMSLIGPWVSMFRFLLMKVLIPIGPLLCVRKNISYVT